MGNGISFGIKGIEIINAVLKAPETPRELRVFGFDIQVKTNTSIPDNRVIIFGDIIIKDKHSGDYLGQYSAAFHFSVDDLKDHVSYSNIQQPELPQDLLNTLLGISVSTLRGLMYGAFKGTFLNNALLPLIDIAQIKPERAPE